MPVVPESQYTKSICTLLTSLNQGPCDKMECRKEFVMDALVEKLDARLREWRPETAAEARKRIAEVIDLADQDVLDLSRSRAVEQEVLDLLDEPPAR
jgi:hypothetical protein